MSGPQMLLIIAVSREQGGKSNVGNLIHTHTFITAHFCSHCLSWDRAQCQIYYAFLYLFTKSLKNAIDAALSAHADANYNRHMNNHEFINPLFWPWTSFTGRDEGFIMKFARMGSLLPFISQRFKDLTLWINLKIENIQGTPHGISRMILLHIQINQ